MIVITGSESFIGKVLQRQLATQLKPYFTVDTAPAANSPHHAQVDICSGDLTQALPDQTTTIIHLAAISRDQDCRGNPIKAFEINVNGTLNVMAAAKARGIPQIIFASSEWVYGEVGSEGSQLEEHPLNPAKLYSEYALTKLVGEQLLRMESLRGSFAATVLRFSIVYGPRPGNWSAVEQLFMKVRRDEAIEVGALQTARRFIHVEDICSGIRAAIARSGFETFNLSGDRLITLGDVITASAQILEKKPVVAEKNPATVSVRNPDNALVRKTLNWRPSFDLESGLKTLLSITP